MKFLVISFISFLSIAQTFAANCEVHSVKGLVNFSASLKPQIEEVLVKKGYKIIEDGFLHENYNVLVDDLKIRQDLLKKDNLIAVSRGVISQNNKTMCDHWNSGFVTCDFNFSLYQVDGLGDLIEIARIDEQLSQKPSIFKKEDRIVQGFAKKVLNRANNEIPECK